MSTQRLGCGIESEVLTMYRPGGYHPVNIGDNFNLGRYRVLQKLGWGGYSTVWLVHDSTLSRLAALKVVISEISNMSNEVRVLQQLASISAEHEGYCHLRKLTDYFSHDGPNGRHQCFVFEINGASVPALVEQCPRGLPGRLAWQISKQITLALDCLHSNGIAHGGNILVSQSAEQFSDLSSLEHLGLPVLGDIEGGPGFHITENFPSHIVQRVQFPAPNVAGQVHATLIDFEQSFLQTDQSLANVCTPLAFRAPETLLDATWDLRMDIWSLACTIFELVAGQPPFDSFRLSQAHLILEWIEMIGDVPEEWGEKAKIIVGDSKIELDESSLLGWLCSIYYDGYRKAEFSKEDIERLVDLLTKMMRYRPEERLSTQEILKHEWFAKNPLGGEDEG